LGERFGILDQIVKSGEGCVAGLTLLAPYLTAYQAFSIFDETAKYFDFRLKFFV